MYVHCPQPVHKSALSLTSLSTWALSKASLIKTGLKLCGQTRRHTPQRMHATALLFGVRLGFSVICFVSKVINCLVGSYLRKFINIFENAAFLSVKGK